MFKTIKRFFENNAKQNADIRRDSMRGVLAHSQRQIDAEIAVGQIPTEIHELKSEMREIKLLLEQITREKIRSK